MAPDSVHQFLQDTDSWGTNKQEKHTTHRCTLSTLIISPLISLPLGTVIILALILLPYDPAVW